MKNQSFSPFVILIAVFLCFCAGLFLGRNAPWNGNTLSPAAQQIVSQDPIDLNQADAQTLMTLPGIGQTLAGRILSYREKYGSFSSLTELLNIDGIGEARLEALLPYITAGG